MKINENKITLMSGKKQTVYDILFSFEANNNKYYVYTNNEEDEDGFIKLTKSGEKIAKRIYERHTVLTKLLISIGVDEKTASEDACRVEHYISDATFEAIKNHAKKYGSDQ